MGAFGAALIAKERFHEKEAKAARTLDAKEPETTMLSIDKINELTFTTRMAKCQGLSLIHISHLLQNHLSYAADLISAPAYPACRSSPLPRKE